METLVIRFNQNLDRKSYIRATVEAVNILHSFSANCGTAATHNHIVESHCRKTPNQIVESHCRKTPNQIVESHCRKTPNQIVESLF